ncbi:hypothetical protein ACNGTP_03660 [Bisgaard Taxon 45]
MSKNITNVVDARRNMVFLVNSQRAEHILYGDKSGGGDKFGLTRILNHKSKPIAVLIDILVLWLAFRSQAPVVGYQEVLSFGEA